MSDEHDHFEEKHWTSPDGLKLHFRDYAGPDASDLPPVVCLPGLTRNSRDFEDLADHLRTRTRVICPTMRGRGDSEYAPDSATYVPQQYVADLLALFEQEGITRAVFVGTSLGGILTMLLAAVKPDLVAGALGEVGHRERPLAAVARDGVARGSRGHPLPQPHPVPEMQPGTAVLRRGERQGEDDHLRLPAGQEVRRHLLARPLDGQLAGEQPAAQERCVRGRGDVHRELLQGHGRRGGHVTPRGMKEEPRTAAAPARGRCP